MSTHQKDIKILNVHTYELTEFQNMWNKKWKHKKEICKFKITVRYFNIPPSVIDIMSRQKTKMYRKDVQITVNQLDLVDINRIHSNDRIHTLFKYDQKSH